MKDIKKQNLENLNLNSFEKLRYLLDFINIDAKDNIKVILSIQKNEVNNTVNVSLKNNDTNMNRNKYNKTNKTN